MGYSRIKYYPTVEDIDFRGIGPSRYPNLLVKTARYPLLKKTLNTLDILSHKDACPQVIVFLTKIDTLPSGYPLSCRYLTPWISTYEQKSLPPGYPISSTAGVIFFSGKVQCPGGIGLKRISAG